MKRAPLQPRLTFVASLLAVGLLLPATSTAELYKYRRPNGETLITTEKRRDLTLVEIISGGEKKKKKPRKTRQRRKRKRSTVNVNTTPKPKSSVEGLSFGERERAFDDIIREASRSYDVPYGFIKGVIRVESAFNPNAVSHAGAMGLMQLMPKTAASLNVTDPFDPRQNVFGGAKFLRILIDRYDGDINLILAAYNAGDAAVARYDGIPYPQTRGYVAAVYQWYQHYSSEHE